MRSFLRRHSYIRIFLCAVIVLLVLVCIGFVCTFQSLNDVRGFVLRDAAEKGNLARVKALVKGHPDLVFSRSNRGWTALCLAVVYDHKEVAEFLLANKADVNARNDNTWTLLQTAAYSGDKEMTELLLAHGADIDARQFDGSTPLGLAAMMGYESEAEFLLAHGADVNARDNKGITPLRWAVQDGHKDLAEILRQHGGHE
jgi:ankyrin repeat protein